MDTLSRRIQSLSADKRALMKQLVKKKAEQEQAQNGAGSSSSLASQTAIRKEYDVIILGGGLAGLTLAIQIKKATPSATILVAEKREHPVPEAAFKVGESTIEVGAHYFSEIIGMKRHLHTEQLIKLGLRYFFPTQGNKDIAKRVEVGPFARSLPNLSYQIDRGRFENELAEESRRLGITFLDGCRVQSVDLDEVRHTVILEYAKIKSVVKAKWVVDASGRAGMLKRKLDLAQTVDHDVNAVWFRVNQEVNLEDWSADAAWRGRIFPGLRRLSTNHLMGPGYWVWLIPLASGSTSIGIVAAESMHPMNTINRLERALDWLRAHEPQCAAAIHADEIQDFRALKHYAHGCKQVFSDQRWCITGEAGSFADPFYSVGSDFIAISNTFVSDLIVRELAGEEIEERAAFYNEFYLDFLYNSIICQYKYQYPMMGDVQIMTTKVVWDFAWYWSTIGLLFIHHKLCDLAFIRSVQPSLLRIKSLNAQMQQLFRAQHKVNMQQGMEQSDNFVDYTQIEFLYQLHCDMSANLDEGALRLKLIDNVALLEAVVETTQTRIFAAPGQTNLTELFQGVATPLCA